MIKHSKHIFKLDPANLLSDTDLEKICESKTDLIIVGGTDNINEDNVLNLLSRIRRYSVSVALEISNIDSVVPGFDHYFVPVVFNTTNMKYQHGILIDALKEYEHLIPFDEISILPYVIMNTQCKAFKKAECSEVSVNDIKYYAQLIEKMYKLDTIYIEYSGIVGSIDAIENVKNNTEHLHIIYGGGISNRREAEQFIEFADTIVVGNSVYTDLKNALKTTNI